MSATSGGSGARPALEDDPSAQAALRELPEALIIGFDEGLRFAFVAGQALARAEDTAGAYKPGEPVAAALPAQLWGPTEPLLHSALAGETRSREIWFAGERCVTVDVGPLRGADGTGPVRGGILVVLDATARRHADLLAPSGFEEVFDRAPVGTGLLDTEGRWMLVNRALCEITGYTADELIGKRFDGIVHPDDAIGDATERERLLAGEVPAVQVQKRFFDASGEIVTAVVSMSLVRDADGAPLHYIAQLQDVSERRELEGQTRRLADHDPLTGLRNRRLFLHDLRLQVARSHRYGETAALMVIDLADLAAINARHGREAGDEALRSVARALMRRLRQTDLIARVGGQEFAILLPHIDAEGAAVVAEGLQRVIPACSVDVGESVVHPAAGIGFTLIDERTTTPQQALSAAAAAMRAGGSSR